MTVNELSLKTVCMRIQRTILLGISGCHFMTLYEKKHVVKHTKKNGEKNCRQENNAYLCTLYSEPARKSHFSMQLFLYIYMNSPPSF
jgi:hypothetical protein